MLLLSSILAELASGVEQYLTDKTARRATCWGSVNSTTLGQTKSGEATLGDGSCSSRHYISR